MTLIVGRWYLLPRDRQLSSQYMSCMQTASSHNLKRTLLSKEATSEPFSGFCLEEIQECEAPQTVRRDW
jgi:hypothetical protein